MYISMHIYIYIYISWYQNTSVHITSHQCSPAAKPNRCFTISHTNGTSPNDILRYFDQTVQTITISYDISTKRAADTIRYDTRLAHDYWQKAVASFKHDVVEWMKSNCKAFCFVWKMRCGWSHASPNHNDNWRYLHAAQTIFHDIRPD